MADNSSTFQFLRWDHDSVKPSPEGTAEMSMSSIPTGLIVTDLPLGESITNQSLQKPRFILAETRTAIQKELLLPTNASVNAARIPRAIAIPMHRIRNVVFIPEPVRAAPMPLARIAKIRWRKEFSFPLN
jgi:hypothetical protein